MLNSINVSTFCMVALLSLAFSLYSCSVRADHNADHRVITIGEYSRGPINTIACDTEEQALSIVKKHMNEGHKAAMDALRALSQMRNGQGEAVCGHVIGHINVQELITVQEVEISSGTTQLSVIRFIIGGREVYGFLENVEVIEGQLI